MDLFELVKQFGPFVAFTTFFVWQGWKRENKLSARIDQLADEQRNMLTSLVERSTEAISRNTLLMEQTASVMARMKDLFEQASETNGK